MQCALIKFSQKLKQRVEFSENKFELTRNYHKEECAWDFVQ
jgi:hypothetical protein